MSRYARPYALLLAVVFSASAPFLATAQAARISEETRMLDTYPFSEPDAVPILVSDPRLYPYHAFKGYAATPEPAPWKVVRLENDYIEVFVLPEVGGKVWGAVVKGSGHEFIYRNEVMKFRNIALRGPWTSGGIEFNFGVIGHTPATATPVDYVLRENDDGSVSCFVGGMDLPSRTHWRVEIRLPADKAYFETNVLWYNPTPLEQPYYNWMTAAAFARDDLELSVPGDMFLEHSGRARPWPVDDQGRNLALYRDNSFDGAKSYHVVGELNDFFGGYYHDDDFGFGHWARYEEMPGQKLWLWALSREGGIWEDLLTDTDGQYIEFQAGRLFVQYQPGSHVNPITQAAFAPMSASRWTETWFPLEGTGGLTDASRDGAMHVTLDDADLTVSVNAFVAVDDVIEVWSGDRLVSTEALDLEPLEPHRAVARVDPALPYRVRIPALDLDYSSDPSGRLLARPFDTDPAAAPSVPEADRLAFEAGELHKARRYGAARELFERVLAREPWHRAASLGLADLDYRAGHYGRGLERAGRALQLDAYDAAANFLAGVLYRARGDVADARDAFGWAARSTAYRSAAYAQLAEIMIGMGDQAEAARYARLSIDFDRHGVPGWRALAVAARLADDEVVANEAAAELISIDPLHHFVAAEEFLRAPGADASRRLRDALGGEFPDQSLLELAVHYAGLGRAQDAAAILAIATEGTAAFADGPVLRAWRAYLADDPALLVEPVDPSFTFPFRRESLAVLAWADERSDVWEWTYLHALNLWAVNRLDEAAELLRGLGQEPDFAPFYVARAQGPWDADAGERTDDLRRAVELSPETRTLHVYLARYLLDEGRWVDAGRAIIYAIARFPDDFNLALLHARALVNVDRPAAAREILASVHVLPSEHARGSHLLWVQANVLTALHRLEDGDPGEAVEHLDAALEWPESLGQGRPYEPEERLVRYLLGVANSLAGDSPAARSEFEHVVSATRVAPPSLRDLLLVAAIRRGTAPGSEDLQRLERAGQGDTETAAAVRHFSASVVSGQSLAVAARSTAAAFPSLFDDLEGRLILRALTLEPPER